MKIILWNLPTKLILSSMLYKQYVRSEWKVSSLEFANKKINQKKIKIWKTKFNLDTKRSMRNYCESP